MSFDLRLRPAGLNGRLAGFVESKIFRNTVLAVIVVNAVVLGIATSDRARELFGGPLQVLDRLAISFFVVEISLKIFVYRLRFFWSWWNLFDFVVVAFSLVPSSGNLSVLRAFRVLRAIRILSVVPEMRQIVQAVFGILPGMASVMLLLSLVFYIFAVVSTRLFGDAFPQWFGTLGESLYSLFQIMTLESWSMGIVRPVMEVYPLAWLVFVPFIVITAFMFLNLFIGLIVNTMQTVYASDREAELAQHRELMREENKAIAEQIAALHGEVVRLQETLGRRDPE